MVADKEEKKGYVENSDPGDLASRERVSKPFCTRKQRATEQSFREHSSSNHQIPTIFNS